MVQTLLSLVALEVVIMTTYNATSDNKGGVMTMLGFAVLGFSLKSPAKLRRSMCIQTLSCIFPQQHSTIY